MYIDVIFLSVFVLLIFLLSFFVNSDDHLNIYISMALIPSTGFLRLQNMRWGLQFPIFSLLRVKSSLMLRVQFPLNLFCNISACQLGLVSHYFPENGLVYTYEPLS